MAEIFTSSGGDTKRTVATELKLNSPSDVYFGAAGPGIAFYEKTGPDLSVTFLDGSRVLLRDFFVIGEGGGYNRLLNGEGGAEEITGLVAPEPLVSSTVVSAHDPVDAPAEPMAADTQPTPDAPKPETSERPVVDIDWNGADDAEQGASDTGSSDGAYRLGGNGLFGGVAVDKLLFGAAMIGTASTTFGPWSDEDSVVSAEESSAGQVASSESSDASAGSDPVDAASETVTVTSDEALVSDDVQADASTDGDTGMDEETAAYVSLLLGDGLTNGDVTIGAEEEAAGGSDTGTVAPAGEAVATAAVEATGSAEDLGLVSSYDDADVLTLLADDGALFQDDLLTGNTEILG